ncbi:hypothetical protein [Streptomyces sp. NRRL S-1022]|uniref:hypothetical protein n=1 Tax=Streptomyces sp. NRRL S-1022 TaxID=1463880 RepID=UPI00131C81D8|nr:hypothetical protein [Streptomyces sp. NRRL S-1022]
MSAASGGPPSVDGSAWADVIRLARHSPGRLDDRAPAWSSYGLAVFACRPSPAPWWPVR